MTMLHHIRRSILDELATAETKRYGQLKPDDLDGNVFTYHLKGLIADKLVQKTEAGDYSLTQSGRDYVVHRYETPALSAHSIFLIVIRRQSEFLLRKRDVQPLIGFTGFVHGEPEAGVDIIESAKRRLSNKTGIDGVELSVAGSALITQYRGGELQSFSHAAILYGETDQDLTVTSDNTGRNFWGALDATEQLLPSCHDIVEMLESGQHWLERTYQLD